jgi:Domain of unknown function (DUF4263)
MAECALRQCLQTATVEREVQSVLEEYPILLARALGGGHGRWVIPQKRLGAECVPDFIIGARSSLGYEWTLVELESPRGRMFKRNGDPSKELSHAIRQIYIGDLG